MNERLKAFLIERRLNTDAVESLPGDASSRSFYRVPWPDGGTAVLMVYEAAGDPSEENFCRMTAFYRTINIDVPALLDRDEVLGILALQDLGDRSLRKHLQDRGREERYRDLRQAVAIITRCQLAGTPLLRPGVPAFHTRFDEAVFQRELEFFHRHFFETLAPRVPDEATDAMIRAWYRAVSNQLAQDSNVLCHRDFHIDNIFVHQDRLFVIDYQDSRLGPGTYDLASLLRDRDINMFVDEPMAEDLKRVYLDLTGMPEQRFQSQLSLAVVQRCLKAIGTFANQVGLGRVRYLDYVAPTLERIHRLFESDHTLPPGWQELERFLPAAVSFPRH